MRIYYILVLMLIRKPDIDRFVKQQFWDSISLANKDAKISDLTNDNIKLTTYTDSLQSLIRDNDSIHNIEISTIKTKTRWMYFSTNQRLSTKQFNRMGGLLLETRYNYI